MDDKSPQHKANHEILYFDELTSQNERIAPGTVLDESHIKSIGREQFDRLVEKGAIKKIEPKVVKTNTGPSIEHTKVHERANAPKAVDNGSNAGDGFKN